MVLDCHLRRRFPPVFNAPFRLHDFAKQLSLRQIRCELPDRGSQQIRPYRWCWTAIYEGRLFPSRESQGQGLRQLPFASRETGLRTNAHKSYAGLTPVFNAAFRMSDFRETIVPVTCLKQQARKMSCRSDCEVYE